MTAFKEKNKDEQYYQDDDGNWIKTTEDVINSLWIKWLGGNAKPQYEDKDGFTVFEYYKENEL